MPKLTFFPLIIDRWVADTQCMSFEERGFYISLLVWMYDTGSAIRNADHAAKELACNPRSARKLLGKIEHKFYRNKNGDLRHKLVDELLRSGGRLRGIRRQLEPNSAPLQLHFNPNDPLAYVAYRGDL